ncbi:uncharacterized protein MONBRDRAFT_32607 [Monosiga brevicollis MX1]|uniref:EGF-like domain-containing protein n=1 Tax=Monosiga brevicollis TaxID=81824 RepID=A9V0P1_MONBE|nr:uncharacterized protein MONBRDRAFT_32607 [Monosiga brevicollis MX1]EDQ88787.1 predicted protein [Monosiga brevicollis MX1]|eukprot:XP_001746400.1 hypothetical protein [Monosiga brevicollis MX1]
MGQWRLAIAAVLVVFLAGLQPAVMDIVTTLTTTTIDSLSCQCTNASLFSTNEQIAACREARLIDTIDTLINATFEERLAALEAAAFGGGDCQPDAYSNTSPIPLTFNQYVYNLTLCEGETDVFEANLATSANYVFKIGPMNGDPLDCMEPFINTTFVHNDSPITLSIYQNSAVMDIVTTLTTTTIDSLSCQCTNASLFSTNEQIAACREARLIDTIDTLINATFEERLAAGPVVTFNMDWADGSPVSVTAAAQECRAAGIIMRSGCMCNAGACHDVAGNDPAMVQSLIDAGYRCGSHDDVVALEIFACPAMTSFTGLENVARIGSLSIVSSNSLTNFSALNGAEPVLLLGQNSAPALSIDACADCEALWSHLVETVEIADGASVSVPWSTCGGFGTVPAGSLSCACNPGYTDYMCTGYNGDDLICNVSTASDIKAMLAGVTHLYSPLVLLLYCGAGSSYGLLDTVTYAAALYFEDAIDYQGQIPAGLGYVSIFETQLSDMSLFGAVTHIDSLEINSNEYMTTLDGLESLETAGQLVVYNNPTLTNVDALGSLLSVTGDLIIVNNDVDVNAIAFDVNAISTNTTLVTG